MLGAEHFTSSWVADLEVRARKSKNFNIRSDEFLGITSGVHSPLESSALI